MIRARCPHCKQVVQTADEHAGKVVACGACKQTLRLPAAAPAPPPEVRPAPPPEGGSESLRLDWDEKDLLSRLSLGHWPDDCPADVEEALGRPLASVHLRGGWRLYRWCFLWAPLGLLFLVSASGGDGNAPARGLVGLILLTVAARLVYVARRSGAPARLWACRSGLLWQRRGRLGHCLWRDIPSFHQKVTAASLGSAQAVGMLALLWHLREYDKDGYVYRGFLTTPQGEEFVLRVISHRDAGAFGALVGRRIRHARWAEAVAALRRGERLDFGPFRMDRAGLTHRGRTYPWPEVEGIVWDSFTITVRVGGGKDPISEPFGNVNHAVLFAELCREAVTPGEPGHSHPEAIP